MAQAQEAYESHYYQEETLIKDLASAIDLTSGIKDIGHRLAKIKPIFLHYKKELLDILNNSAIQDAISRDTERYIELEEKLERFDSNGGFTGVISDEMGMISRLLFEIGYGTDGKPLKSGKVIEMMRRRVKKKLD